MCQSRVRWYFWAAVSPASVSSAASCGGVGATTTATHWHRKTTHDRESGHKACQPVGYLAHRLGGQGAAPLDLIGGLPGIYPRPLSSEGLSSTARFSTIIIMR